MLLTMMGSWLNLFYLMGMLLAVLKIMPMKISVKNLIMRQKETEQQQSLVWLMTWWMKTWRSRLQQKQRQQSLNLNWVESPIERVQQLSLEQMRANHRRYRPAFPGLKSCSGTPEM
jgi:uncharacterized membrane protein YccC